MVRAERETPYAFSLLAVWMTGKEIQKKRKRVTYLVVGVTGARVLLNYCTSMSGLQSFVVRDDRCQPLLRLKEVGNVGLDWADVVSCGLCWQVRRQCMSEKKKRRRGGNFLERKGERRQEKSENSTADQ